MAVRTDPGYALPDLWLIPSSTAPGDYYRVTVCPGDRPSCSCPWGRRQRRGSKCWHVRFVLVMESPLVRDLFAGSEGIRLALLARQGDTVAQLQLLEATAWEIYRQGGLRASSRAFETISRYLLALSVQGSVSTVEPACSLPAA